MLRSPKGKMLSQMYQYEPVPNLAALPQYDYNLVVLLMSIAGQSARAESKFGMNGMMQHLFPDGKKAVEDILWRGWVVKAVSLCDPLEGQTVSGLKKLLSDRGMMVSGLKDDLINRLRPVMTKQELKALENPFLYWQPTPFGFEYIRSLYKEREDMEEQVFQAILVKDFSHGAEIARRYLVRFPVNGELGCDDYTYLAGEGRVLARYFENRCMYLPSAIACFNYLVGPMMFPPLDSKSHEDIQKANQNDIRYFTSLIRNASHVTALKRADIKQYRIKVAFDDRTCEKCAAMDRKVFDVKDAITGQNCPPFHKGCRCCIIGVHDLRYVSQQRGRGADGKSVLLPGNMTYSDWQAWKADGFPTPVEVWYQKHIANNK